MEYPRTSRTVTIPQRASPGSDHGRVRYERAMPGSAQRNREWIQTDGTSSYCSLTESWEVRRKYHGLYVPALGVGHSRRVVVQNILINGEPPVVEGILHNPVPCFMLRGMKVEVLMPRGSKAVLLRITSSDDRTGHLTLRPILTNRSIYDVREQPLSSSSLSSSLSSSISPSSSPSSFSSSSSSLSEDGRAMGDIRLHISSDQEHETRGGGTATVSLDYDIDSDRGESHHDTGSLPLTIDFPGGWTTIHLAFSLEPISGVRAMFEHEILRRKHMMARVPEGLGRYSVSTEQYLLEGGGVIAGYHWFSQWGRDTLISLPGLMLIFGRYREARQTLKMYAALERDGLIPNAMDERTGSWGYNTVDAGFWFINRLWTYHTYTGDSKTVRELLPTAMRILEPLLHDYPGYGAHEDGMEPEMRNPAPHGHDSGLSCAAVYLDDAGCVCHPPQWTWMDAVIDGNSVVERRRAVEIQALAYAGAMEASELMERTGYRHPAIDHDLLTGLAQRIQQGFKNNFIRKGIVQDIAHREVLSVQVEDTPVVPERMELCGGGGREWGQEPGGPLRPNVMFSVYFPHPILPPGQFEPTLRIMAPLMTPFGMRTISPGHPSYHGTFLPGKDRAYHNGTVWPFLAGALATSWIRVFGSGETREKAREEAYDLFLRGLLDHLLINGRCPGHIAEIVDGDYPFIERGCIAQAWSIAEPLRAYWEDVLGKTPVDWP